MAWTDEAREAAKAARAAKAKHPAKGQKVAKALSAKNAIAHKNDLSMLKGRISHYEAAAKHQLSLVSRYKAQGAVGAAKGALEAAERHSQYASSLRRSIKK